MLKNLIYRIMWRRHFWRNAGFDELSELYVSSMLRMLALTLMMVFVPFFLYQNGYSIAHIFATYGTFFATRILADIGAGHLVARFGPKHTMIISCLLQIYTASLFMLVPEFKIPGWVIGIPWGMAASCYFVAYHVEFSKIKHAVNAGKELGYMHIMEKMGAIVGPLIGGLTASAFGSRYIFVFATVVLIASLWPLFMTSEPTKTHQKLNFKDFPVQKSFADIRAYCALGVENTLCINVWPLFLGIFVLSGEIYAQLGILSSAAVVASLYSAYAIGKFIDVRNGRQLLRIAAVANAAVYLVRPFVGGLAPALAVNVVNDTLTTGYRMPFLKGMYAAADDLPGYRIVYIASMESVASVMKSTVWFMLAILAHGMSVYSIFILSFAVAGVASLLIVTERFKALGAR